MRYSIYLLFILIFFSKTIHAETLTLSFNDLSQLVYQKNENILAATSQLKGAQSQQGHLKRSFLPNIKGQLGVAIFETGTFEFATEPTQSIEATSNLFRGGKDKLEDQIKNEQSKLANTKLKKFYSQELFKARSYYIDLLYYQELIQVIKAASSLNRSDLSLLQRQINAGLINQTNRLEFDIENNQFKQDLILLKRDYESTLNQLKVVLGIKLETALKLEASFDFKNDSQLYSRELRPNSHFEITALKTQETILRNRQEQAKRWWLPSIDAYINYSLYSFEDRSYFALGNQDEFSGGMKLSIDLFDGFQAKTQGKLLQAQAQSYRYQASQKSKELEVLFKKLKYELKVYPQLLKLEKKIILQNRNYYQMAKIDYQNGLKNSLDLMNIRQRLFERQKKYAELKRKYWMLKSHLLAILGE